MKMLKEKERIQHLRFSNNSFFDVSLNTMLSSNYQLSLFTSELTQFSGRGINNRPPQQFAQLASADGRDIHMCP